MKSGSFNVAILSFFLGMVYIFIIQKICPEGDRLQAFLNKCSYFAQISLINIIRIFSAQNMDHNQLKTLVSHSVGRLMGEFWTNVASRLANFFYGPFSIAFPAISVVLSKNEMKYPNSPFLPPPPLFVPAPAIFSFILEFGIRGGVFNMGVGGYL